MATTQEENERLTHVGPGTPMGNLLRRYWQPVGAALELDENPVRRVRIFGEDLVLYRSKSGEHGLVDDVCPHRCMSMEYGIPDERGLRCGYHGWLFDRSGQCIEAPFEDRTHPEAHYRDKITIKAYPVQELGGLLFAYLGPQPAPLLPRWDLLVRDDLNKALEIHPLPCNWLQCMDNAADPTHFEFLHAGWGNYALGRMGLPPAMKQARHIKIDFEPFRFGIIKRRLTEGESEDVTEWRLGHPLLFPNMLAVGNDGASHLHFRVAVDDTNTRHFTYWTFKREPVDPVADFAVKYTELFDQNRRLIGRVDCVGNQDMVAWVAQGPISQRTREHLASGDRGIIMYHKLLMENIERVERGEDPMGIIRDSAENEPMIDIKRGHGVNQAFGADIHFGNNYVRTQERADLRDGSNHGAKTAVLQK